MVSERQVGEWTVRVFRSLGIQYKVIATRGEGKARQVRVYDKLTLEAAEGLVPSWQS